MNLTKLIIVGHLFQNVRQKDVYTRYGNAMFKGIVPLYKGRALLFLKHLKSAAKCDVSQRHARDRMP